MAGKFTDFEKKALDAQRNGSKVEVEQKRVTDGPPVVTLHEFASSRVPVAPGAPAPLPEPPTAPGASFAQVPAATMPLPSAQDPVNEDIEQMKRALYGDVETQAGPDEETAPAEPRILAPTHCPRCSWQLNNTSVSEPDEEDKLAFIESVLGGQRFMKCVSLLGGKMKVTFRMVTVQEEDVISEYLNQELGEKRVQNQGEWMLAYNRARLVVMLHEMELGGKTRKYQTLEDLVGDTTLLDTLKKMVVDIPKGWPVTTFGLVMQGMMTMTEVYSTLMARAYDPNFWEAPSGESA